MLLLESCPAVANRVQAHVYTLPGRHEGDAAPPRLVVHRDAVPHLCQLPAAHLDVVVPVQGGS